MWTLVIIFVLKSTGAVIQEQDFPVYSTEEACLDARDFAVRHYHRPWVRIDARCEAITDQALGRHIYEDEKILP